MRLRIILIALLIAGMLYATWLLTHRPRKSLMERLSEIPDATLLELHVPREVFVRSFLFAPFRRPHDRLWLCGYLHERPDVTPDVPPDRGRFWLGLRGHRLVWDGGALDG